MLRVGLNPYGIAYTIGVNAANTARGNPLPLGLSGYINLAKEIGASGIEIQTAMLNGLDDSALEKMKRDFESRNWWVVISFGPPVGDLAESIRVAKTFGAKLIRVALTTVLEGGRAQKGAEWPALVSSSRAWLKENAKRAADAGLEIGIENHQDFTSAEMLEMCEAAGANVGVTLDCGNALSVGEDPVEFAKTIAPRIRHVHLKDYRAQWTDEGYRLCRCAIGDGALPFAEIARVLHEGVKGRKGKAEKLTAAIEPGALNARHIRLLTPVWWEQYPPRDAKSLAAGIAAARVRCLDESIDWRTPFETDGTPEDIVKFEMTQLQKSVANLKAMGWMS